MAKRKACITVDWPGKWTTNPDGRVGVDGFYTPLPSKFREKSTTPWGGNDRMAAQIMAQLLRWRWDCFGG